MNVHYRFDGGNAQHARVTLFLNGKSTGQLCLSPGEAIWLHHILHKGCQALSPKWTEPVKFLSSGTPPDVSPDDIDAAMQSQEPTPTKGLSLHEQTQTQEAHL